MNSREKKLEAFGKLLDIMDRLRRECPWDREQTFETIRTLTIEETYELSDAILKSDMKHIKKELGDVLLHIVFYSKIASETNDFDIADVCEAIAEKLIYRHPHVFGDTDVNNDSENVKKNWEELKLQERNDYDPVVSTGSTTKSNRNDSDPVVSTGSTTKSNTVLGGVPPGLPAMIKASRIQEKVKAIGFDWDKKEQVWDKVSEELEELRQEIRKMNTKKTEEEFGDLMFSVINAARLYNIDPENALELTNRKFIERFNYLESKTLIKGKKLRNMTLDEMNEIWEESKKK